MTKTERSHWLLSVVLSVVLGTHLMWTFAIDAQSPQPMAPTRWQDNFDIITFENGSVWYLRQGSIQAIWAVPHDDQEKLGYKTKIYGSGFDVMAPYEVNVILKSLAESERRQLDKLIEELENSK